MAARQTDRPPVDFDAEARKVWRVARAQLLEQGTWKVADEQLLALYVRSLQTARLARARIQRRLKRDGEEAAYFSTGSLKQLVSHPDVQLSRQAEGDAAGYAAALLLSPVARLRAKVGEPQSLEDEFTQLLKERS
jgi:phage terminase small subunit